MSTDKKYRQGITNVEGQHNILHTNESLTRCEAFQPESKFVDNKNILILKDYETDRTTKRNFYSIANNIPNYQLGEVESRRVSEKSESRVITTTEQPDGVKLDTVRSGESLIKHFNFDTCKYNNTNKCIAFWRTLMQTDLKPVKCTLLKGGRSSMTSKQRNREEEENVDYDSSMWYKALIELQKRKMDEAAFAAVSKQCKLCGQEDEPYSKFKKKQNKRYSESELKDYEDIACLNYWNPNGKQIAVKKPTRMQQEQRKNVEELPVVTLEQQIEAPSPITIQDRSLNINNEGNTSTYDNQQAIAEEKCGTDESHNIKSDELHTITLSHADPCKCGRTQCLCNECDASSEKQQIIESSNSEPCKCGRTHCFCNCSDESSQELEAFSLFESKENNTFSIAFDTEDSKDTISTKQTSVEKTNTENVFNEKFSKGILPQCTICKTDCKCWEHKIEMSKQFIEESRFQLKYLETTQDKSCETENEVEEKIEEQKKFCIICGHNDCNCNGPHRKQSHKYFQYIEFDDNIITSLLLKKEKSLSEVTSLTNAEKVSRSTFQKKIYEHSQEDVCCIKQKDEMLHCKQAKIKTNKEVVNTKKLPQQKLLITPEQRAKDITIRNKVILEPDKYGIPQLIRYADGRLAPRPTTSKDILSLNNSDHADC